MIPEVAQALTVILTDPNKFHKIRSPRPSWLRRRVKAALEGRGFWYYYSTDIDTLYVWKCEKNR